MTVSGKTLTFEQRNAVHRGLIPIGDRIFDNAEALKRNEFSVFLACEEFLLSLAESEDDIARHRICQREGAKQWLGAGPFLGPRNEEQIRQLFRSPVLESFAAERAGKGTEPVEGQYKSLVADDFDPCIRRRFALMAQNRSLYDRLWEDMVSRERAMLANEVQVHATGLSRNFHMHSIVWRDRHQFLLAAMERHGACLGFRYDKLRTRGKRLAFSRPLLADWDLCLFFLDPQQLFWSFTEGKFDPSLVIHRRGNRSEPRYDESIVIFFQHACPAFSHAYRRFHTLDEFEVIVRANLYLLDLIIPALVSAAEPVLG